MSFDPFKFIRMVATGQELSNRNDALRYEEGNIIIDTCYTDDTGKWETGIITNKYKEWVIVEQYNTQEEAKEGHERWCIKIKGNPNMELISIQYFPWEKESE